MSESVKQYHEITCDIIIRDPTVSVLGILSPITFSVTCILHICDCSSKFLIVAENIQMDIESMHCAMQQFQRHVMAINHVRRTYDCMNILENKDISALEFGNKVVSIPTL